MIGLLKDIPVVLSCKVEYLIVKSDGGLEYDDRRFGRIGPERGCA